MLLKALCYKSVACTFKAGISFANYGRDHALMIRPFLKGSFNPSRVPASQASALLTGRNRALGARLFFKGLLYFEKYFL
jgi:hypothetical protein